MESPPRSALRAEYQPARGSPLRSVSSGKTRNHHKTTRTEGARNVGTPFALTIPPLPPSSITAPRKSTPRRVNDENASESPNTTVRKGRHPNKRTAIPAGDQTIFAPVLLGVGDQSLLMDQQLPSYKDLWNESEDEGEDELSFMVDSMEQHGGALDGSVRSRGAKGRKSILGQSSFDNRATKPSNGQTNSSRLASLYKPTPKPDTSSRRRSTLLARSVFPSNEKQALNGDVQDLLVPMYVASSPMPLGTESTPVALALAMNRGEKTRTTQTTDGSGTEDEGDGELGIMDEQMLAGDAERQSGSEAFASQASLASASQAIPNWSQTQGETAQPSPRRTSTPPSLTARRVSPVTASATPKRSSAKAASKKRTPSQRPEGNATPSRALHSVTAKDSPNPRARKTARKSTKAKATVVEDVVPSSPAVPLATETREARMSMGLAPPSATAEKPKSRRRSTAAPVEKVRRPRVSKASQATVEPTVPKTRRLSGRKSTGSIPTSQKSSGNVKRARHSLSAAKAKSESPKGRRRPRQSLAPLELVERVGLLDIPQRPASPTEDPLLLIPSVRKSVGARRSVAPSQRTLGRQVREGPETADSDKFTPRKPVETAITPVVQDEPLEQHLSNDHHEAEDQNLPLEQEPRCPSTPASSHSIARPTSLSRALGSSPWVSANLSIFSPNAMASSPVRPSPVRWRIASPAMEEPAMVNETSAVTEPAVEEAPEAEQLQTTDEPEASPESTPKRPEASQQAERVSLTPTLIGDTVDETQYQDAQVDFLPDTEWRAFERDDSPMSDQEEERAEMDGEDVNNGTQLGAPDASATEDTVDMQAELDAYQTPDTDTVTEPPSAEASPEEMSVALPDPPLLEDAASESCPVVTKKRVGRICLRLPLHPVIVKIEPVELNEVAREDSFEEEEAVAGEPGLPKGEASPETQAVAAEEERLEEEASDGEDASHSLAEVSAEAQRAVNESAENTEGQFSYESERLPTPLFDHIPLSATEDAAAPVPSDANDHARFDDASPMSVQPPRLSPLSPTVDSPPVLARAKSPLQENENTGPSIVSEAASERERAEVSNGFTASPASPPASERPSVLRPLALVSSATMAQAESPFQTRKAIESETAPSDKAATPGPERVFRESVSSVSVTSEDSRAAARAAALLKLHFHYLNDGPVDAAPQLSTVRTPENIKISPRRRRISQYFQTAETASSLSLPELLQEAELELVDTTAQDVSITTAQKRSFPVYSPFPMPGSWAGVGNGASSPFQRGRINCASWTIEDWQDLERCYKRLYKKRVRTSSVDKYVWTFEDGTEVIDNLCKLKRITKAELRDEWSSQTLRLRINTLHRKRKSNDQSAVELPVVSASASRSPKRLKSNDSSIVESPSVSSTGPTSHRFKSLLTRGWKSVMQILEPTERSESSTSFAASSVPRVSTPSTKELTLSVPAPTESLLVASPLPLPGAMPKATPPTPAPVLEKTSLSVPCNMAMSTPAPVDMRQVHTPQPTELRQVLVRRASVLARAKELNDSLQGQATPLVPSQLARFSSTPQSDSRKNVIPDASSARPIISLPRRSLVSQDASPSVKNMIQSFEKSFESDTSSNKGESPVSNELRRLSLRRSVSGKSSLREVLEKSMGSAKHDTP